MPMKIDHLLPAPPPMPDPAVPPLAESGPQPEAQADPAARPGVPRRFLVPRQRLLAAPPGHGLEQEVAPVAEAAAAGALLLSRRAAGSGQRDGALEGTKPFLDRATASALLDALWDLPRGSRLELDAAIAQVAGLRQGFALPRALAQEVSASLTQLRAERDGAAGGTAGAGRPAMDGRTASAILGVLRDLPIGTREEINGAATQLLGLMRGHELPPQVMHAAERLLGRMEQALGALPAIKEERAQVTFLDAAVLSPAGPHAPTRGGEQAMLDQVRALSEQTFLHPMLRDAADRAVAFLRLERDGSLGSTWDRPSLWLLPTTRLERSIFRQARQVLMGLMVGKPGDGGLHAVFGDDAGRVRLFAADLAERSPADSLTHCLAAQVRDAATDAGRTPNGDGDATPVPGGDQQVPGRHRGRAAQFDANADAIRHLAQIAAYASHIKL